MEFQSTKGAVGVSPPVPQLTTNQPPTFWFCQVLHAGDRKWETARAQMGGGERTRGEVHRLSLS